jgi:hypothetical protein
MSDAAAPEYTLPVSLTGHSDLSRLGRAVELLEGNLQAQRVRNADAPVQLPSIGQALSDFIEQNKLDVTDADVLAELKAQLRKIKDHAPVMHMTFANEVDPYLLQKLVMWLRTEIHPHALLDVGLQPGLVGGVYLRTPNKVHDFSVKALLKNKRDIIFEELQKLNAG